MKFGIVDRVISISLAIGIVMGVVICLGALYVIGFWLLGKGLISARRSTQAATWPTAPGVIESLEVKRSPDENKTIYEVVVEYTYVVNGVTYQGSRLAFGYEGSDDRGAPAQILQRLKGVKNIGVRYDPSEPAVSCLSFGLHRSIVSKLFFAALWLLVMFGITLGVWMSGRSDTVLIKNFSIE
jgi:hypothetical protein